MRAVASGLKRKASTIGLLLAAVSMLGFTRLEIGSTGLSLQAWLILREFALGLVYIPLQTLALSVVSNRAMARASSLVSVTSVVFGAVGVSALTTYLTQQATAHANDAVAALHTNPPTGIAASCVAAGRNASALKVCIGQHVATMALNDTFMLVLILCAIYAALALFVGRDPAIILPENPGWSGMSPVSRKVLIPTPRISPEYVRAKPSALRIPRLLHTPL